MTKIKTERNFGAVIPFSELNIGDVFVSKDNNENLYIKICESTDELNMSNNTIGIGQAYTMFTDDDDEVIRVKRYNYVLLCYCFVVMRFYTLVSPIDRAFRTLKWLGNIKSLLNYSMFKTLIVV